MAREPIAVPLSLILLRAWAQEQHIMQSAVRNISVRLDKMLFFINLKFLSFSDKSDVIVPLRYLQTLQKLYQALSALSMKTVRPKQTRVALFLSRFGTNRAYFAKINRKKFSTFFASTEACDLS
jgi:hypothetical protein